MDWPKISPFPLRVPIYIYVYVHSTPKPHGKTFTCVTIISPGRHPPPKKFQPSALIRNQLSHLYTARHYSYSFYVFVPIWLYFSHPLACWHLTKRQRTYRATASCLKFCYLKPVELGCVRCAQKKHATGVNQSFVYNATWVIFVFHPIKISTKL